MKRFTSLSLAVIMFFSFPSTAFAEGSEKEPDHLIIDQVYGGGGKGETPIANSFIELYNPTEEAISLSGYQLVYSDNTLDLTGTVPADGSYLVVGAAEATTDEFLTYDLPEADQTCDWTINNKTYTIDLKSEEIVIDTITGGNSDETKISKQKSLRRVGHGDTLQVVVWEKLSVTVDEAYVSANAPRNSKGEYGKVHVVSSEPVYTPVVTGDTRVKGYYDQNNDKKAELQLELSGRYNSGAMNADGGSLEIVAYNPVNGFAYAVSGVKAKLIAVNLNGTQNGEKVTELTGTEYDLATMMESAVTGFTYGDMTSVSVSPDGSMIAVAIQAEAYNAQGVAALFSCNPDGSIQLLSTVEVGVQPDMITFANGNTILTADEGEPRLGTEGVDPKGSVSIITIGEDHSLTANVVDFTAYDEERETLTTAGVLIQKDKAPSVDFEPEYIAVSGNTAYVALQEANAIAVLDIARGNFTGVYPLGFQDYGTVKVDLQKDSSISLENYPGVYGIKMPDGISVTTIGGKTYLLTANEGDSRADWTGLDNESEGKTSPTGNITLAEKVVWFNADLWDGLDQNNAYVFGGRSFSIYEVKEDGLNLVYDSGSDFEEITASVLPEYFNASNDKISLDNRSGKKGPEPESVVTGVIDGKTYAFIALERIGGIMVYDISDPAQIRFVNYINSREFDAAIQGDVSPEGLCFIPESQSKTGDAMLLAACEVSGTLAAYSCTYEKPQQDEECVHSYTSSVTKEPTTDREGIRTYTCSKCGDTYTEAIAKLPANADGNKTEEDKADQTEENVGDKSQGNKEETGNIVQPEKSETAVEETQKKPETWEQVDGKWYYTKTDGSQASNEWELINGKWYAFDGSGSMKTGWYLDDTTWYYLNESGAMETGWELVNDTWYYMNTSGAMETGWELVNDIWYYMDTNGAMQTGWVWDGAHWYYMSASGAMKTGWQQIGGTWYYMNANGAMQTGWVWDGSHWYYMNESGAMQTGWLTVNGVKYYMQPNGAMSVGKIKIGSKRHYFARSGAQLY